MEPSVPQVPPPNRAARRAAARRKAGAALSATALATSAGALAVAAAGPAVADTTFTVTSLADDGSPGTLRWAIDQANATAGADTIDFDGGVTGTIELTSDLPTIQEALAIAGPGAGVVTISGMDEWSLLGFTDAGTSSVSGLTLTRGVGGAHNTDNSGGGLSVYGTDVTASGLVITANYTYNDGGGAWCLASLGDNYDTITASLTITGSLISGNDAGSAGGGIYAWDCDLTVVDSVISGNTAGDDGGGIYFQDSTASGTSLLRVRNTAISGNTTEEGGGGVAIEASRPATHRIENSTVSGNVAGGDGGAIYAYLRSDATYDATLVVSNSTLSGNSAVGSGSALFVGSGDVTLVQTTVTLNSDAGVSSPGDRQASTSARIDSSETDRPGAVRTVRPQVNGLPPSPATLTLLGTIVAGNPGGDLGMAVAADSSITASSSVLGTSDPGTNLVDAGGNQAGVTNPLLGPLQDNGGPTRTHALLDGSPAIDAGAVPPPTFPLDADDQRGPGYARISNGRIDVGAFEVQVAAIEPNFTG